MNYTAIETAYAGCRFRSRIEARWAVFLDTLGIGWQYEPQGFDLPSGRYLPDFLIELGDGFWWEVKGQPPSRRECDLGRELFAATKQFVYIAHGDIPRDGDEISRIENVGSETRVRWFIHAGQIGFIPVTGYWGPEEKGVNHLRLVDAYTAARSARFEHGEAA